MSYLIGEAARRVGVSPSALRLWERQGLVRPRAKQRPLPALHRCRPRAPAQRPAPAPGRPAQRAGHPPLPARRGSPARTTASDGWTGGPSRRLRQAQGLSLRDAAEAANLSVSFISSLERGVSGASVATLQRLTAAYGTTIARPVRRGPDGRIARSAHAGRRAPGAARRRRLGPDRAARPRDEPARAAAVRPRGRAPRATAPMRTPGEEFLYLLSGARDRVGRRRRDLPARPCGRRAQLSLHAATSLAQRRRRGDQTAMDQHATDLLTDWAALRAGIPPVWARYTDLVVERASGSWIETIDGEPLPRLHLRHRRHQHRPRSPARGGGDREQAARGIHLQQNIVYHQPGLELHRRLPRALPESAARTSTTGSSSRTRVPRRSRPP